MRLITAIRLEQLFDKLALKLAQEPLPPEQTEWIVICGPSQRRYLTLHLARKLGCAANLRLLSPRELSTICIQAMSSKLENTSECRSEYSTDALAWRLLPLLEKARQQKIPGLSALQRYLPPKHSMQLPGDWRGAYRWVRQYQLASRIAACFEAYQWIRPETLEAWLRNQDELPGYAYWQAWLWRELCKSDADAFEARRLEEAAADLRSGTEPRGLPSRLHLIGQSPLLPALRNFLSTLSRHAEIYHYALRPTVEPARAWLARLAAVDAATTNTGNPLLQNNSAAWRKFFGSCQIEDDAHRDMPVWEECSASVESGNSLLKMLQADLLHDRDRGGVPDKISTIADDDFSLQIHACHSPMREIEVLKDHLLQAFAQIPGLQPDQILVLVPDMETYASSIDAVFGAEREGEIELPYTIADRKISTSQPVVVLLLKLLKLTFGRMQQIEILSLLEASIVQRAARIEPSEIAILRHWVEETNIVWGIDGAHRKNDCALPALEEATWRNGLKRLLLGYATGPIEECYEGIFPAGEDTVGRAELLGRFCVWVEDLFELYHNLRIDRTLQEWAAQLQHVLDRFFLPDNREISIVQKIRERFELLATMDSQQHWSQKLPLAAIVAYLEESFARPEFDRRMAHGKIVFCALEAGRLLPAKVIAVTGMEATRFPRRDRWQHFDLRLREPQEEDASRIDEDRRLFLQLILTAEERLIFSYCGYSQKDNSSKAPSLQLQTLCKYLDRAFQMKNGSVTAYITRHHSLQPFSMRYFNRKDPRFFSYSVENGKALLACQSARQPQSAFVPPSFTAIAEDRSKVVVLNDLVDFWYNPSRYFCKRILGLGLQRERNALAEHELFEVKELEGYLLKQELMRRRLKSLSECAQSTTSDDDLERTLLTEKGLLPLAGLGKSWHVQLSAELNEFAARVHPGKSRDPLEVDIKHDAVRIIGTLDALTEKGRFNCRYALLKPKDLIVMWVNHVVLQMSEIDQELPRVSLLYGSDKKIKLRAVADPGRCLQDLLAGFFLGQEQPLCFFEKASREYAIAKLSASKNRRSSKPPIEKATVAFVGTAFQNFIDGDLHDPHVALLYRGRNPLVEQFNDFDRWSRRIWGSLLEAQSEVAP